MTKIEQFFHKQVGLLFVLFILNAVALTYFGAGLKAYTDLPKLDFMIGGYTQETILQLIAAYGNEGLNLYYWLTVLDMPFPFLVFGFTLGYVVSKLKTWNYRWFATVIMISAYAFLLFDLIENITVFALFDHGFEWVGEQWIAISSLATQIKLISLALIYLSILIVWGASMIVKVRTSSQR